MRTFVLKINMSNMKEYIDKDYFKYKDIFYKCLIANLCAYNTYNDIILTTTIIEDSHYNQYLLYFINNQLSLEEIIVKVDLANNIHLLTDIMLYLEEFIKLKHDKNKLNLYSLTIDDCYNVLITNKQIKKYHVK